MNPSVHALRLGVRRGWIECVQSLRSPQDLGYYVFTAGAIFGYLWLRRDDVVGTIGGSEVGFTTFALPSILGGLVAFSVVIGPAYSLAMEREDGTLLRHKAVPHGLRGYFTAQILVNAGALIPQLGLILLPSLLFFDHVFAGGGAGALTLLWVLALGMLATMPLGMIIGSLVPNVQKVGTWGMFPFIAVLAISGIFFPITEIWGSLQVVAQVFPVYWIGLGMRSAFMPDSAASLELGGSWQTPETILVLGAWAVVGAIVTPIVLGRMAKKQSGSRVQEAREEAAQWVR